MARLLVVALFCWSLLPLAAFAETNSKPVTFVAYNLKNYLRMERRVEGVPVYDAPKPDSEIEILISHLIDISPDILGVCEIGDQEQANDLQARLKSEGVDLPHLSLCLSTDGVRNLALLSRFPISAENHQSGLIYQIDGEALPFRRGILDATVSITPDYEVRFLGLHFKSKRPVPEADQSLMRRNEAHLTRLHIESILATAPETNLVIYGDLNDTRNEAPVRALMGTVGRPDYIQSVKLADSEGATWTYFWSHADVYSRFDFILNSKGMSRELNREASYIYKGADWYTASDHRPLVLSINPEEQ